jgi:hypothetical protein
MKMQRCMEIFKCPLTAHYMIDMSVCIDEILYVQLMMLNESKQFMLFRFISATGINKKGQFFFIIEQVSIFLKGVKGERFQQKHGVKVLILFSVKIIRRGGIILWA